MSVTVKGGILIGVLCGAWTLVMGLTGWYKDPVLLNAFFLVILMQIGVMIWALRQTAAAGKTYGGQIGAGALMSVVGGGILFCASFLFTMVLFPHYFEELRALQIEMLKKAGTSEAEISAQLQASAAVQTPFMQALFGFIGTVVTGLIASLIIGVFYRKK